MESQRRLAPVADAVKVIEPVPETRAGQELLAEVQQAIAHDCRAEASQYVEEARVWLGGE